MATFGEISAFLAVVTVLWGFLKTKHLPEAPRGAVGGWNYGIIAVVILVLLVFVQTSIGRKATRKYLEWDPFSVEAVGGKSAEKTLPLNTKKPEPTMTGIVFKKDKPDTIIFPIPKDGEEYVIEHKGAPEPGRVVFMNSKPDDFQVTKDGDTYVYKNVAGPIEDAKIYMQFRSDPKKDPDSATYKKSISPQ